MTQEHAQNFSASSRGRQRGPPSFLWDRPALQGAEHRTRPRTRYRARQGCAAERPSPCGWPPRGEGPDANPPPANFSPLARALRLGLTTGKELQRLKRAGRAGCARPWPRRGQGGMKGVRPDALSATRARCRHGGLPTSARASCERPTGPTPRSGGLGHGAGKAAPERSHGDRCQGGPMAKGGSGSPPSGSVRPGCGASSRRAQHGGIESAENDIACRRRARLR